MFITDFQEYSWSDVEAVGDGAAEPSPAVSTSSKKRGSDSKDERSSKKAAAGTTLGLPDTDVRTLASAIFGVYEIQIPNPSIGVLLLTRTLTGPKRMTSLVSMLCRI